MNINANRLWMREMNLGHIGEDPSGGISRFSWTHEYTQAVNVLSAWMREIGMEVRMDTVGNLFGRMEGRNPALAPVLVGSHLDTVPNGGCFDGIAGIMSALEALTTMYEKKEIPERPIELVAFINEEGNQFLGGCFGSKAMRGLFAQDYPDKCQNRHTGQTLRDAMKECGMDLDPDNLAGSVVSEKDYYAFLELHIEQGKYLLQQNLPVAVVTSIAGIRQFYITVQGVSCHAGGMAMKDRHDAMAAAAQIACEVERLAMTSGSDTRSTVGYIHSEPAEQNIVANKCVVSVDYREESDDIFAEFYDKLMAFTEEQCQKRGLTYSVEITLDAPPAHCHERIMKTIEGGAVDAGIPYTKMTSFPAHDAMQMGRLFPMAMIFLRSSNDGLSHCPEEFTTQDDLAAGTEILYRTLKEVAGKDYKLD